MDGRMIGQWSGTRTICFLPLAVKTTQRAPTSWQSLMVALHWEQVGVRDVLRCLTDLGLMVFRAGYVSDRFEATCESERLRDSLSTDSDTTWSATLAHSNQ